MLIITMLLSTDVRTFAYIWDLPLLVLIMRVGLFLWVQVPVAVRRKHQLLWGWS